MKRKILYVVKDNEFESYQALKTWGYFNLKKGEIVEAYELEEDVVKKEYKLYRQERRLIVKKKYDEKEDVLRHVMNQQLNLW